MVYAIQHLIGQIKVFAWSDLCSGTVKKEIGFWQLCTFFEAPEPGSEWNENGLLRLKNTKKKKKKRWFETQLQPNPSSNTSLSIVCGGQQ